MNSIGIKPGYFSPLSSAKYPKTVVGDEHHTARAIIEGQAPRMDGMINAGRVEQQRFGVSGVGAGQV